MKKINWRYAIGELIIITFGISLAFGLNNWASHNRDRQIANEYLSNIKSDLEYDIQKLDSNLLIMNKRVKYLQSLFMYFRTKSMGQDTLDARVFQYFDPIRFYSRQATFQSMKYSGDIKLIRESDLKNEIVSYYESYGKIDAEYERHRNFAQTFLAPYFMEHVDFATLQNGSPKSFEDPYFQKLLVSLFGIYLMESKAYEEVQKSSVKLIKRL